MGNHQGKLISLSVMSHREIVLNGFFNLIETIFLVSQHTGKSCPGNDFYQDTDSQYYFFGHFIPTKICLSVCR